MELAWKAFVTKGMPAKLQIACVIASQQGVEHLEKLFPGDEVTLWCAAIDPEMNEHSYIVPGLGDAGDLASVTRYKVHISFPSAFSQVRAYNDPVHNNCGCLPCIR